MQPSAVPQMEHLKRAFLHVTAFHPTKPTEYGGKLHGPSSYRSYCLVCFFLSQVQGALEEEQINPHPPITSATHPSPLPPTHPYTQGLLPAGVLWGSQSLTSQIFICYRRAEGMGRWKAPSDVFLAGPSIHQSVAQEERCNLACMLLCEAY